MGFVRGNETKPFIWINEKRGESRDLSTRHYMKIEKIKKLNSGKYKIELEGKEKIITYDDVIKRIGYFRTKANLSMREASLQLGYNPQFMSTIENKTIELKVKTLLDFCNMLEITPQDFFYMGEHYNKEDKIVI